jgi:hypothetical protein
MKRAALALCLGLAGHGAALAQIEVRPLPSPASQCLVATDPKQPAPAYPFKEYREGTPGRVLVELRFTGPDRAPAVRVLEHSGGSDFAPAVRAWARTLRVPCHTEGEAVLVQEYLFRPFEERVVFGPPADEAEARRAELARCVVHERGPSSAPRYPGNAQRRGQQGRVFAQMRFNAPDQPPEVTLLHRPEARVFADAVLPWTRGWRMPCFEPGRDESVRFTAEFVFKFQGEHFGFRPMTLLDFMSNVKGVRAQALQMDTHAMGCPFDVQLQYLQPLRPNIVGTRGEYRAEREPLLQWLRQAELQAPPATLDSVYADSADITVPCIRLQIDPAGAPR